MTRPRYFTGRQVVTIVVAICLTIVLMPTAVWAANTSLVRITDGNGTVAQVDSKGRLLVTDGNGAMSVDGNVAIKGGVSGTIADPRVPSRKARVDAAGRLNTVGPSSTFVSSGLIYNVNSENNFLTDPTSATLHITRLTFSNPSFNNYATWAEVQVSLYQTAVDSNGICTANQTQLIEMYNVAPGEDVGDTFPEPLVVAPADRKPYCLDLYVDTVTGQGARFGGGYLPNYNLSGYATGGTIRSR
jgi:hypothetical protein